MIEVCVNEVDLPLFSDWYSILNRVYRANELDLKQMKDESANIRNAVVRSSSLVLGFKFFLQFENMYLYVHKYKRLTCYEHYTNVSLMT